MIYSGVVPYDGARPVARRPSANVLSAPEYLAIPIGKAGLLISWIAPVAADPSTSPGRRGGCRKSWAETNRDAHPMQLAAYSQVKCWWSAG